MQTDLFGRKNEHSCLKEIDLILTFGPPYCCMADAIDIKTGIQSGMKACKNHPIAFIDNEFKKYNHAKHVAAIKEHRPEYATVRDAVSLRLCIENDIAFYELDKLLEMYQEIRPFAGNIIVISKYKEAMEFFAENCTGKFLFGYPNNTYGRTTTEKEITVDAYKEYPDIGVHILGGSPASQKAVAIKFDGQVKSLDNNYIFKVAPKGVCIGKEGNLADKIKMPGGMDSIMIPSMAVSICSFRSIFDQKWRN